VNIKRIYGVLLATLGIGGLVYSIVSLLNSIGLSQTLAFAFYGLLGLLFILAGINLIRAIKDKPQ